MLGKVGGLEGGNPRFRVEGFPPSKTFSPLPSGKPSRRARGKCPPPGVVCPPRAREREECICGKKALARAVRQCARHCGNGRRRYRVGGGNVSVLSVCRPLHAGSIPRASPLFQGRAAARCAAYRVFSENSRSEREWVRFLAQAFWLVYKTR